VGTRSAQAWAAALFGIAIVAGALAAPRADGGGRTVTVVERDFRITVSTNRVPAGDVTFRIDNDGPDAHELILVRDRGRLPLRADGITVDEDALEKQTLGAVEPAAAGARRVLRVRLTRGRYLLLCNMYGHFMGGMHAVVVAR
jgi:uncharacterized cupredoxin-like copper-binding protein